MATTLKLTGAERYQAGKLEQLEKYVDEQVASGTFNLDANLALLRLYQFHPAAGKAQAQVAARVLLKALMQLPQPDFKTCVSLVSDRMQAEDPVGRVIELGTALESGRFSDFWTLTGSMRDVLATVPGFYDAVRHGAIIASLSLTYQKLPKRVLAESLRLEGATLDQLVQQKVASAGWAVTTVGGNDIVALPKNDYNQLVVKRTQEVIKFDQVAPVLRSVTVGYC